MNTLTQDAFRHLSTLLLLTRVAQLYTRSQFVDFTDEEASKEGKKRAIELFAWLYGFALLLWLIGFYIAVPLMVLAFMIRHKESLVLTISLPVGTGTVTWLVFGHFLHLPFPPGLILEALGLD